MKLTLEQCAFGYAALDNIGRDKLPLKMIRVSWALQHNKRLLADYHKEYEEKRMELLNKYGQYQGENRFFVPTPNALDYQKELDTLGATECEIVDIHTIDIKDFIQTGPDPSNVGVTPNDLFALDWMFLDDLEAKAPEIAKSEKEE